MTKSEAERLTRIETLLEAAVTQRSDDRQAAAEKLDGVAKEIKRVAEDVKAIRDDLSADKAELKELKNKGAGILIGVGLAGGAIGGAVTAGFKALGEFLK